MPLPGEVFDFINRKSLNNTKITSDIDMRVGNNIISGDPTCEDTKEISDLETDDEIEESKVENFGRVFPPDKESLSVEYEENYDDISPMISDDKVLPDERLEEKSPTCFLSQTRQMTTPKFPDPIEENMSHHVGRYDLRPGRSDRREIY